jgi:hypothetical protein
VNKISDNWGRELLLQSQSLIYITVKKRVVLNILKTYSSQDIMFVSKIAHFGITRYVAQQIRTKSSLEPGTCIFRAEQAVGFSGAAKIHVSLWNMFVTAQR